jgi:hypothetical protein
MNRTTVQYALLGALACIVLWRGVIPALDHVDTDFPNYYTAARLVLEGESIGNCYDNAWFSAKAQRFGLAPTTRFAPFPPATAFVMLPVAWLAPLDALRVWTMINMGLIAIAVLLLMRITSRSWLWCALIILASGVGLINNFRFGQFYVVLLLCVLMMYRAMQTGRGVQGGVALGVGIAVKYYPAVYLMIAIARRQWRLVATSLITVAAITVSCILLWGSHGVPFAMIAEHLSGSIDGQSPFAATFQTWTPLLRRLFVMDPIENPSPAFHAPMVFELGRITIPMIAALILAWSWHRTRMLPDTLPLRTAMIGLVSMWVLPLAATYHFILLALPVALVLASSVKWGRAHYLVLMSYLAVGFMPYALFREFEGAGWLNMLAFPRLWVLTTLMVAGIIVVREHTARYSSFTRR